MGGKVWKSSKIVPLSFLFFIINDNENNIEKKKAYLSEYILVREKKASLLMFLCKEKWHYLVVTKLSTLFTVIILNQNGDFYCFNCLYSFRIKTV